MTPADHHPVHPAAWPEDRPDGQSGGAPAPDRPRDAPPSGTAARFAPTGTGLYAVFTAVMATVLILSNIGASKGVTFGPIVTADWQLRVATSRFRELTLYAVDRYRTKYKRGGAAVDGSSGNYLDAGVRGVLPVSRASAVLGHLNVRNHTGLRSDNSLATAAITSAALTLGLVQDLGNGYALQPFARAQAGRAKTGNNSASARGLAAGVTLGMRF